jgi:hypothetical protein
LAKRGDSKKEIGHSPKESTSRQRNCVLFAFTFAFAFAFALPNPKKIKDKEKGVRIQAIIGRIRTPDPDPGHFDPDFFPDPDSNLLLRIPVPVRPTGFYS